MQIIKPIFFCLRFRGFSFNDQSPEGRVESRAGHKALWEEGTGVEVPSWADFESERDWQHYFTEVLTVPNQKMCLETQRIFCSHLFSLCHLSLKGSFYKCGNTFRKWAKLVLP